MVACYLWFVGCCCLLLFVARYFLTYVVCRILCVVAFKRNRVVCCVFVVCCLLLGVCCALSVCVVGCLLCISCVVSSFCCLLLFGCVLIRSSLFACSLLLI